MSTIRPGQTPEEKVAWLREIIGRLRAPDGCPWDREQSPASVKKYVMEEAYELIEALDNEKPFAVAEELGDLFFMLFFLSHMYEESGAFSLTEVFDKIGQKMIRRHPHVFGEVRVRDSSDVVANWQAIKAEEARDKCERHSVLGHLPRTFPALQRAFRVGERASRIGFDWPEAEAVWHKLAEEEQELREAIQSGDPEAITTEVGDLLFTVVNLARLLGVNPEEALQATTNRFTKRFQTMEKELKAKSREVSMLTPAEMDAVWEAAKVGEAVAETSLDSSSDCDTQPRGSRS